MSITSVALSPAIEKSAASNENFPSRYGQIISDSILIFLSVTGSIIPMRIMESDSIASVKLRIQNSKGFFVRKQMLVFKGRELARNNSRVQDYGIANGNVLHLVLKFSDLMAITVRTVCGKKLEFHIARGRNVAYVKEQVAKKGKGYFNLKDQELVCDGEELEDQRLITDICKNNDAMINLLVRKSAQVRAVTIERDFEVSIETSPLNEEPDAVGHFLGSTPSVKHQVRERTILPRDFILEPLAVNSKVQLPLVTKELIDLTFDGLERGNSPIRSSEGSGGAYFMQDSSGRKYIAVFKPIDEEPMALNNPRGLPLSLDGEGLKKGTRVGEGAPREVAAFLLDHPIPGPRSYGNGEKGFAGVPPTVMVKCLHRGFNHPEGYEYDSKYIKIGSLQMFIDNVGSCEDMGPRAFPVEEVHKISVLDIRLANADRHAGNILVTRNCEEDRVSLVPIDHGYCMPENFEDCTFDWLYWPQAQEPYSPNVINYIKLLDAEKDIELLKLHGWDMPPKCARTFRISTMLLKKGVERGLTPFSIGRIMCRETLKQESVIEQIIREAEEALVPGMSDGAFFETVALIMDQHLDELTP
ncbi:Phosphatidylinositol 4-kinase gamma 3 [Hibiscus syriacus]|uniref:1-phosphatidylinositol 4-kinase n=1 Tax=Hibiscus syriacus TaxID=106335 RepID=A0A6A2YF01_HIBSY|nr:phosphatidylinositol 4-kinase gamma 3-like [Hibiscus syriacus]KAE8671764.1 Phosphatidylinositol 4-kinase gamma 3 [Hibiscus syriacus]